MTKECDSCSCSSRGRELPSAELSSHTDASLSVTLALILFLFDLDFF